MEFVVTIPLRPGVLVKQALEPFISKLESVRIDHVLLNSADLSSTSGAIVAMISSACAPNGSTYLIMLISALPAIVLESSILLDVAPGALANQNPLQLC